MVLSVCKGKSPTRQSVHAVLLSPGGVGCPTAPAGPEVPYGGWGGLAAALLAAFPATALNLALFSLSDFPASGQER